MFPIIFNIISVCFRRCGCFVFFLQFYRFFFISVCKNILRTVKIEFSDTKAVIISILHLFSSFNENLVFYPFIGDLLLSVAFIFFTVFKLNSEQSAATSHI